ncbi:MAG: hypothetical protein IAE79_17245 [Anaerolinea sp.]|nr:hypothetical protein [Anaerolinea sp.]
MSITTSLEKQIFDTQKLISEYEQIKLDATDPKEKRRCEREIANLWGTTKEYLNQYYMVCQNLNHAVPEEIQQIASNFPEFLAREFQQVFSHLRTVVPEEKDSFEKLSKFFDKLNRFHQNLNEWKEAHNLIQDCITDLIPFRDEVEAILITESSWNKAHGRRLWRTVKVKLSRFESFAHNVNHISEPLCWVDGRLKGESWMVKVIVMQRNFEESLPEGDVNDISDMLDALWYACYDALYIADKHLLKIANDLYSFSNSFLRKV